MSRLAKVVAALVLLVMSVPALAQDTPPPEVQGIIQTLEIALGVDIDPAEIENLVWRPVSFATTALGCPYPQTQYEVINATGYQVYLDYEGVRYDYRVTAGSEYVVLCSTANADFFTEPEPTVEVVSTVVVPEQTNDNTCPFALLPRLTIGEVARTTPVLGSNIRDLPDLDATEVGLIEASDVFTVIGGPECGPDGNYWWNVDYQGVTGWTIQGQNDLYFVEPIPQPLVATTNPISSATISSLTQLSAIEGNILGVSAWSPDGQRLVIADASTANPGFWIYFIADLSQVPVLVETAFDTTAMAFSPDGSLLAVGDPNGNVHFLETETYAEVASLAAHDTAVLSINFSPFGDYVVVIDDNYSAAFYGVVLP